MQLPKMTDTQKNIIAVCDNVKNLLLEKNKKYGDSALNPCRIFSKVNTLEQLCVRIDDKLSRISKGAGLLATDEDVIQDLIGYLVLLRIALMKEGVKKSNLSNERVAIDDKWDGSDVEPVSQITDSQWNCWNTSIVPGTKRATSELNDAEWFDMYAAGDKFG